jgi:two-component system phosphate regulon response regulator PhoB
MARRILVVEDEAPIREMVCFVLEQNGFQPVEAEDYDSAVNQLNEPWPDLILLDWMLPGGSGIQFIKHLKREAMTRDIPVMMLTARGEEEIACADLRPARTITLLSRFRPRSWWHALKPSCAVSRRWR